MTKRVFKYEVGVECLPEGSVPLYCNKQNGRFYIWVEVDDSIEKEHLFDCQVYGTGHKIESEAYTYLNTLMDGGFVWHVYWRWMG